MSSSFSLNSKVKILDSGVTSVTYTVVGNDMTSKVFAIEVLPGSSDAVNPHYRFSHVCHPSELIELPEEETADYSYFRTDEIELIFDTPAPIEAVTAKITSDLRFLARQYNALATMDGLDYTTTIS